MRIDFLSDQPAGTAFVAGVTRPASTEIERGVVIVKTTYDIGPDDEGQIVMTPSATAALHDIQFADTRVIDPDADPIVYAPETEADIALEKRHADVVVAAFISTLPVTASVTIDGDVWLSRTTSEGPDPDRPDDVTNNLFGWITRGEDERSLVGTITNGQKLPGDYEPEFNNFYRRSDGYVAGPSLATNLPAGAEVVITRDHSGSIATYRFFLPEMLALQARYFTYCGHGIDKLPFWVPSAPFDLTPDTLIIRPDDDQATILWRGGWPLAEKPTDLYRTVQISAEGFI